MGKIITLEEMKKIELNILKKVNEICKTNGLKYSLMDGSLIGAVRHKGFIPWDDDIDIMMPRPDYEKLKEIMISKKFKGIKYLSSDVQDDYYYPYAKIVSTETLAKEYRLKEIKNYGVFIDVFPIDGVYENKIKRFFQRKKIDILFKLDRIISLERQVCKNKIKYIFKKIIKLPLKIIGIKTMLKITQKLMTTCNYDQSKNVTILCTEIFRKKNKVYKKEIFERIILTEFEKEKLPIIENYNIYLKDLFGDYMTFPPIDKRKPGHKFDKLERKK